MDMRLCLAQKTLGASYACPPRTLVLDPDHSEDAAYGQQPLAFYNHFYQVLIWLRCCLDYSMPQLLLNVSRFLFCASPSLVADHILYGVSSFSCNFTHIFIAALKILAINAARSQAARLHIPGRLDCLRCSSVAHQFDAAHLQEALLEMSRKYSQ